MSDPVFQIFECQNPDCKLRFPSNLSIQLIEVCPLCKSLLLPSGQPFSNEKFINSKSVPANYSISLLLDNLRSTLNVGSIFRTANGAGISHIYCCGTTPTPEHPKIIKTGLGAEFQVPWSYYRNSLDVINKLGTNIEILSLEATQNASNLFNINRSIFNKENLLLIVGNEISGIDPLLLKKSKEIFFLPMLGSKNSLNVAVAIGIAIYYLNFSN